MTACLLGIGSNLGDRAANLQAAIEQIDRLPGRLVAVSTFYGSAPIGGPSGQPDFLNAAVIVDTPLAPRELLVELQRIETQRGRVRSVPWAARPLDLDILLVQNQIVRHPELIVPHPAMVVRHFVLGPAAEIAADWRHPELQWTIGQLWDHLRSHANRFLICGSLGQKAADAIAAQSDSRWFRCSAHSTAPDPSLVPMPHPTRLNEQQALESWERCVQVAEQQGWNDADPRPSVLAVLDPAEDCYQYWVACDLPARRSFERACVAASHGLVTPKLVLVQSDLVESLQRWQCCPWLEVHGSHDDQVRVVAGAIGAMQIPGDNLPPRAPTPTG
jgi:2-amino-4-hydroxy-6-hydroxymethyldihydropteridine diphosphokinase